MNNSRSHNWGFVPFTKADFDGYTVDLQLIYSRDWYMIAEQVSFNSRTAKRSGVATSGRVKKCLVTVGVEPNWVAVEVRETLGYRQMLIRRATGLW